MELTKIDLQELKNVVSDFINQFENKQSIQRIGVFGSVARGDYDATSDIDLAIDYKYQSASLEDISRFFDLCTGLTSLILNAFSRHVDVLEYNAFNSGYAADLPFKEEVDKDVIWLYG